jgi:HTH-type transcriptional regulator/antitoxin HigA
MEALIDQKTMKRVAGHFAAISQVVPLHPIRNQRDYDRAVKVMQQLLDHGGADENHPLGDLVEFLGELIANYDDVHYPMKTVTPVAMLRFFMEQHSLTQSDLPEIGSQGVVSEVLRDKRSLNARQIKALAQRFGVSPAVFI